MSQPTFQVSSTGQSVQTATGPQSLLKDSTPLTKLDTTKTQSFQTISVLFNHEPPQPTALATPTDTLLYQFAHGYNYIPSIWMSWQNPAPAYPASPSSSGATATTFNAFGDETASNNIPGVGSTTSLELLSIVAYDDPVNGVGNYTAAFLYCIADATNISIYVRKFAFRLNSSSAIVPLFIIGITVNMRVYVFTEPATTIAY